MENYSAVSDWQEAILPSLEVAARYQPARPFRIAKVADNFEWQTGLRSGLKINVCPDHRNEIPAGFVAFVECLKELAKLSPNWDSYQGQPLDVSVERPAVDLAILSNERSNFPTARLLPTGGLSLRWTSDHAELEIDLSPKGTCEALFETYINGSEIELPRGSSLAEAKALLRQFNAAG